MKNYGLLLTCEHASNQIPEQYKFIFSKGKKALNSHMGWDIGAFDCYQSLINSFRCEHLHGEFSRLLIDLNRTPHHRNLYSQYTKTLDPKIKKDIAQKYYLPYHYHIAHKIGQLLDVYDGVIHLSIHSFTPIFKGEKRTADIGLLYDPSRKSEISFCQNLKSNILSLDSKYRVRMNYPYLGISDGLTTHLRKKYKISQYFGCEIELNQSLLTTESSRQATNSTLIEALKLSL